jgi:type III secretion protein C
MRKFLLSMVLFLALAAHAVQTNAVTNAATTISWKAPRYSLVAQSMNIRQALESFGSAQGISVVMSQAVAGSFSGTFSDIPAAEFLDRISTSHNLIWYYDGAALYIYGSWEVATILLDLKYMKAAEVRVLIRDLGVEDSRFPIKTASNDELIMVSGPPRYVTLVAETIAKADKLRELRTFNEVEARVFPLVNTWADDVNFSGSSPESSVTIRGVANILAEIMSSSSNFKVREAETNKTENVAVPDTSLPGFTPIIRPDNRLNAVIVRDVVTRLPMYEELIKQLDVPQKLVEIAVTVVELSREDALDWQLSFKVDALNDDKVQGGVGQNARNLFTPASLAGKGLAGAVTYLGEDVNVSASLSALREKGKARSISRTSLLTLNNLAAQLSDTQSYHARVVGTEVASLEEVSAGTRLQIKPRIIKSTDTNKLSRVWLTMELQDGGFESVTVDAMPMTRTSTLETQASVLEHHSILLAGYMRDIKESAGWGIPYLRDIPWIGWIFGGASTRDETVQRLFILTPYIVDADEPDLVRVQATRQRDITLEEKLENDKQSDDMERKKRNDEIEEMREIREEKFDEWYYRDKKERKFRKERREDEMKASREVWDADFERRVKKYEEEKKAEEAAGKK